ncbi:MAG: di-trans,poly-cis-decaprenylcistransferase [Gammaproteobacteria bacterium]|nr:di-trans,poly-cis-decaprenylcistransferase [Gammaproteobacteria bacterium]
MPNPKQLKHIAIIMDGNGRWAKRLGWMRPRGHRAGVDAAREVVRHCGEIGIEELTLFAFSTENWQRPKQEVTLLMRLFTEAIEGEVPELDKNNARLKFIGSRIQLPDKLVEQMTKAEELTAANTGLQVNLAIAYGGHWDIVNAAKNLVKQVQRDEIQLDDVDESYFAGLLSLDGRRPDLLIRTGGEQRISNFLLWQVAYSELFFTDTLWPDFSIDELDAAIASFQNRDRRFGRVLETVKKAAV